MGFDWIPLPPSMVGTPHPWSPMSADLIPHAKLMALLRRFMMEHAKSSTRSICFCPICVDARKLIDKALGEKSLS